MNFFEQAYRQAVDQYRAARGLAPLAPPEESECWQCGAKRNLQLLGPHKFCYGCARDLRDDDRDGDLA